MSCRHSRQTDGQPVEQGEAPRLLPCAYPGCPEGTPSDTYCTAVMPKLSWSDFADPLYPRARHCVQHIEWRREQMGETKPQPQRDGGPEETVRCRWFFWRQVAY